MHYKDDKGIALVIVLTIVMLLTITVFAINSRVRKSLHFSMASKNRITMQQMAKSGINLGIEVILKDAKDSTPESVDSIHEDWAKEDVLSLYAKELVFERGEIKITITDEMGKIKVNSLIKEFPGGTVDEDQKKIWENIFDFSISADKSEDLSSADSIISCLIDWLDQNDLNRSSGAESDYYESLTPPYKAVNGPFKTIEELNLVKGMNENILNIGSLVDSLTGQEQEEDKKENESSYDISDYISIAGNIENESKKLSFSGKININTAELPVVVALLPKENSKVDRYYYAKSIIDFRDEVDETGAQKNSLNGTWYLNCPGCFGSGIEKSNIVTTVSNIFKIESKAIIDESELKISAIVERYLNETDGKWYCKVINFQTF